MRVHDSPGVQAMQVLIVRHAIAVERGLAPYDKDEERPLTERGKWRMRDAARGLARLVDRPDAIYTSPLVRADETARILAKAFGGRPEPTTTELLAPGHTPAEQTRWLATLGGGEVVALVGHEPSLSELILYLVGAPGMHLDLKKGGAALIECEATAGRGRGILAWFATPRLLRAAGGKLGGD
jgi:phosphohistidine phosphatase